jgi:ankyrin repeat protein
VSAVQRLLEEDRKLVNARDYDSRTPLHVAALQEWIDVERCLIDRGADVNVQDHWKNTMYECFNFVNTEKFRHINNNN